MAWRAAPAAGSRSKVRDLQGVPPHGLAGLAIAWVPRSEGSSPSSPAREPPHRARPFRESRRLSARRSSRRSMPTSHPEGAAPPGRRTLSGGEQQMLAIARAMMLEPKIICSTSRRGAHAPHGRPDQDIVHALHPTAWRSCCRAERPLTLDAGGASTSWRRARCGITPRGRAARRPAASSTKYLGVNGADPRSDAHGLVNGMVLAMVASGLT